MNQLKSQQSMKSIGQSEECHLPLEQHQTSQLFADPAGIGMEWLGGSNTPAVLP